MWSKKVNEEEGVASMEQFEKFFIQIKEKILESFFRMAKFYGFHVFYNIDGSITIKPNDVIDKGWLNKEI